MACVSALRWRASAPRSGPPSAPVQLQLDAVPFDAVRKPEALLLVAIGRDGDASRSSTSRAELAASLKFPLRDLRCLTKAFDISQVLVRPEAVVVNLKYVRAVLTAGKVLLLDEMHVPEELVTGVRRRIKSPFPVRNEPFEVLVLEALLHYMHERLEADYNELEPSIYALLASLEGGDPTESQLRALLNLSKQLGAFAYDVGELKETLDRLQASDEDMAQMYLSRGPSEAGSDHHEIEILLENYSRRLEEIRNSVSELQGYIQATEAYLKARRRGVLEEGSRTPRSGTTRSATQSCARR